MNKPKPRSILRDPPIARKHPPRVLFEANGLKCEVCKKEQRLAGERVCSDCWVDQAEGWEYAGERDIDPNFRNYAR